MDDQPTEPEKADRQASNWLNPPLTDQQTPVAEGSLLAATVALGDSTDRLVAAVEQNKQARKFTIVMGFILAFIVLMATVYGVFIYSRIAGVIDQNTSILREVQSVTNPDAQQKSIDRANDRTQLQIYCNSNYFAHTVDPSRVPLDPRCPSDYPN